MTLYITATQTHIYTYIYTHTKTQTLTHTSMGINVIKDERHVIFNCDLYAGLRTKLIARLNSAPEISSNINNQNNYLPHTINERSLQLNIMKLLSHNTASNPNNTYIDQYNYHPLTAGYPHQQLTSSDKDTITHRRFYIINCVCSYISHIFTKRWNYIKDIKERNILPNTIVINFNSIHN